MTTIKSLLSEVSKLGEEIQSNRDHTNKEAAGLLAAFDDAVTAFADAMATVRHALVTSYKGQIEADRIMVGDDHTSEHDVLPFKTAAAE